MEVRHYHTGKASVWVCPLPEEGTKREKEQVGERRLLRYIFGEETHLAHDTEGKPFLPEREEYISISHSKRHLCIAISSEEIGVDIEEPHPRLEKVKHKFLTSEEQNVSPRGMPYLTFLAICWSAKEAIYKIAGKKAGAIGEHIRIFTDGMEGKGDFYAQLKEERYHLEIAAQTEEYEIVTACRCMNK